MVIVDSNNRPRLAIDGGTTTNYTDIYEWGSRLAETPMGVTEGAPGAVWNACGWKELVEHMPAHKQVVTAILLENVRSRFGRMHEATRTSSLGTFDKWIFPVLANLSENDVIDQIVSVQPMAGPVSQIVYMDIVTDRRKGRTPAGAPIWRALQGAVDRDDDGDEYVQDESGTATNSAGNATITLEWTPLRPGTLSGTIGAVTVQDDSNGNLLDPAGSTVGTVNYVTGAVVGTLLGAAAFNLSYAFNSEGNLNIMGAEMKLTSTPVTARVMKFKAVWTEEADQNLSAMYNIKAEPTIMNAITGALQYQKHRQVIFDLRARADAGFVTWDALAPASVNYQTHKLSITDAFETGSAFILGATNMASANWIIAGLQACTVIKTLPQFVAKNTRTRQQGVTYIGDLGDKKVFQDPHYPNNEFLLGYLGDDFITTGYVLAEYMKLYTTQDVVLPDFNHNRGFATSFARKCINSKFYARGLVINGATNFGPVIG